MSRFMLIVLCLAGIYCGTPGRLFADTAFEGGKNTFNAALIFQTWKLTSPEPEKVDERLSQVVLPLFWTRSLSSNVSLSVSQANAIMRAEAEGADDSFSGLGDTKLKLTYEFPEGHVKLNAGMSLPTGDNFLSPAEVDIANQFYSEVLGFRVNRLGEGVDLHLSAGATQSIAAVILSAGLGYLRKGSYDVMEGTPQYDPGEQFQAVAGAHLGGNRIGWGSNLAYTKYTADLFDNQIWFEQGAEVLIDSTVRWGGRRSQFELMFREILRGKNRVRTTVDELSSEILNTNGNRREIAFWGGYQTSPILQIYGQAEYQSTRENEKDEGESAVWLFTIGANFQLTDHIKGQIGGRLATGEMRNGAVDLQGLGTWFGVSSGFMR